ncbi:hypothetical protein ACJMK2_038959 [Sinanodonta woodiana]|uniref:FAM20 C-terminal domain-containing protein n=1 Tax=Sinanodonta woodiana TaxID=1069815 RepID=A0ABD3WBD8_SINWO
MKLRQKFVFLVCISFVLYVSYKILEPEISGQSLQEQEQLEFRHLALKHNLKSQNPVNVENSSTHIKKEDVIQELIQKYRMDLSYPLNESPWRIASKWVTPREIIPESAPELGGILKALITRKIISADIGHKGTQLKMTLVLEGGQKVVFKPKRFERAHVIEGSPYSGEDRHNGEIAAFHLSRILELRRTPVAVGRMIDLNEEIKQIGRIRLLETFFNRDENTCFYGKCLYCHGPETGVCAKGSVLEGTLVLWLPEHYTLKLHKHPWARTYKEGKAAKWETDEDYCFKVTQMDLFREGPRLMDIIDTAVFDFLIGNADRHHYETFEKYNNSMIIMLDNGKSFGNPRVDEISILAPLYQCCSIRRKTWLRLLVLQDGILSEVLEVTLTQDPLNNIDPILTTLHLQALDRRLKIILDHVQQCFHKYGPNKVLIQNR